MPNSRPRSSSSDTKKAKSAWDCVELARHSRRPKSSDYLAQVFDDFTELRGDRNFGDDPALIGGLGKIDGRTIVVLGQEKGSDTATRIERNFGMMKPEGYRKALRLMKFAEKFQLPVVCLIDTPGAHPGLEAEERGQGWAIAQNLKAMAMLEVPIIAIIIGEGCSGGALAIGLANEVAMLENSYYSVISPEGCAEILWRERSAKRQAAESLQLTSEKLLSFGMIDAILPEPELGAHSDQRAIFETVERYLVASLERWSRASLEELLTQRRERYRLVGAFTSQESLASS